MQRKFSGVKKNKNRNRKKYRGGFFEVVENRFFDSDICEPILMTELRGKGEREKEKRERESVKM